MFEPRAQYLTAKRHERELILSSRKRKLSELYNVSHLYSVEVPTPPVSATSTPAEIQFLDDNDILKGRSLNESSIPTRRQLRSDTSRTLSSSGLAFDTRSPEINGLPSRGQREDGSRKSTGGTPAKHPAKHPARGPMDNYLDASDAARKGRTSPNRVSTLGSNGRRASSRGAPANVSSQSEIAKDTIADKTRTCEVDNILSTEGDDALPVGASEKGHVQDDVESRPGSPGVDPRHIIPISAEDAAQRSEPVINGLGDKNHKASTVHLPPRDVQERHLREIDRSMADRAKQDRKDDEIAALSIKLPPPHNSKTVPDPMSSPGSTIGAHSATTPVLHDASTDTSPENEGPRYNLDRADEKDSNPQTPPELAPSKEELLEKEEHDKILKAQMDIARADILGSSPTAADAQLRLEDEQAAHASSSRPDLESDRDDSSPNIFKESHIDSRDGNEAAQDLIDDEEDEVVGVPTPEEKIPLTPEEAAKPILDIELPSAGSIATGDPMEVDKPTPDRQADVNAPAEPTAATSEGPTPSDDMESPVKPSTSHKGSLVLATPSFTPRRAPSMAAPTPPTLERMTTRVSSGAMRHRSVSEILGEIPKPNTTTSSERPTMGKGVIEPESATNSNSQSRSTTPQSPGARVRSMMERAKDKERSKLSTVVFAKQPGIRSSTNSALLPGGSRGPSDNPSDYFMPLILAQAHASTRGIQPLDALMQTAHKTITTSNAYVPFHDHQTHKILRRIHSLQSLDKWSFRQPKRSPEPNRPTTHWDELLKEAKWMRTDFREERKWKHAVARNLANACAEWVAANVDDRKLLQVKASPPSAKTATKMQDMTASCIEDVGHVTPDLVASTDHISLLDDFDDEPRASLIDAVAPTAMFSLSDDDVVFGLRRSPATDKLLEELPMYGCALQVPQSDLPTSEVDPDASWRRPALPLSKYIEGKIVLKEVGPPRKKSRYQYDEEDDEDDHFVFGDGSSHRSHLDPIQVDVALFNPENKHIRDRIHAGHQFRPPSEYPMPLQSFFECRTASQWTWAEDDELKALVREYSYNWSLISSMLSTRSLFASGPERRTPWECFERWIHLEGLPADMQKTHYFRAYNNRLEAAQRNLIQQAAQAPPQVNAAGAAVTPSRRRTTTSVRVERRRNNKHLALVDAMRKLAKKRETSLQKQQHAAGLAAMRKANEAPQPQAVRHTPQDFSRLKHERELQMQERMARMQLQQEAQRRAIQQQARNAQNPQQYAAPNGAPQQPRNPAAPNGLPAANQTPNANRPNQLAVPGQALPHGSLPPLPNGMGNQPPMTNGHAGIPQMPMKGTAQGQMQGMQGMQPLHRLPVPNPAPDLRLVLQARQMAEQQRQTVQMQQQSQQLQGQNPQIHNSPPNMRNNMNSMNGQAFMQNQNNQAMMAAFNPGNGNGGSSPPSNNLNVSATGPAGSPRVAHPGQVAQHPNGQISQVTKLEAQFRASYPSATQEQIRKMVGDSLSQTLVQQQQQRQHLSQAAMNAAAGSGMSPGLQNSPQQYAQMLRAQQERQAAAAAGSAQQTRSTSAGSGMGK